MSEVTRSETALLGEAAAELVASDDELRSRVKMLMGALMQDAEHIVMFGNEKDRAQLIRAILPAMMKSLGSAEQDQQQINSQQAYDRLRAELRGEAVRPPDAVRGDAVRGDVA